MKVASFMSSKVLSVSPKTPLPEVWKLIFQKHIHALPVIDEKKRLLGIIAEQDLLIKFFPDYSDSADLFNEINDDELRDKLNKLKKWTADRLMNTQVIYTRENTNVMRALSRMIVRKLRQLPVLDEEDHVIGVISKADIFRALFRKR